jgi:hypothetical protein
MFWPIHWRKSGMSSLIRSLKSTHKSHSSDLNVNRRISMANSQEHILWGAVAGAGVYILYTWIAGEKVSFSEFFGSALSSALTAKVPEMLEPATHPNHRAVFHSVCFAGLALSNAWVATCKKREEIIGQARECERRAAIAANKQERDYWSQQANGLRFCAGSLLGLVPGYASHLAADALTPKGLPLLR